MKLLSDINHIIINDKVIVANNRQVVVFKKQYFLLKNITQAPKVLTWNNLLIDLWQYNFSSNRLIADDEMYHIFIAIIEKTKIDVNDKMVKELIINYKYQQEFQIPLTEITSYNFMHDYFIKWIKNYNLFKISNNLVDIYDVFNQIITTIKDSSNYYTYGFKSFTTQQKLLFKKIKAKKILELYYAKYSSKKFNTISHEIYNIAKWSYKLKAKNNNLSIAIICPELEKYRADLELAFIKRFDENFKQINERSFNFSLGIVLGKYQIIKHLLLVIKISQQIKNSKIKSSEIIKLLISPYILNATLEKELRVIIVNKILKLEQNYINNKILINILHDSSLIQVITNVIQVDFINKTYNNWLFSIESILNIWGFASDNKLTIDDYQVYNKYKDVILILNKFNYFKKNISFNSLYSKLLLSLNNSIFQPKSSQNKIQIIGLLEAMGLHFDKAWIMGLNSEVMPIKLVSLRYLPLDICNKYKIPSTNYDSVMCVSKIAMKYLLSTAKKTIVSCAENIDNKRFFPSNLIKWQIRNIKALPIKINTKINYEQILDNKADKLQDLTIKNGVKVLKEQLQCQFNGFANRLKIDKFKAEVIGISAMEQGIIIHKTLELFYKNIKSKQQLLLFKANDISILIKKCIKLAMSYYVKDIFYKVEYSKVCSIIESFIIYEIERNDDWEIKNIEQLLSINIAQLTFDIKVDRIDIDENNNIIIFDYKTGKELENPWYSKKPKEIQLLIYAITNKANDIGFIYLGDKIIYKRMQAKNYDSNLWQQQLNSWQNILTTTANNFSNGNASVLPAIDACRYCELDGFCRVNND